MSAEGIKIAADIFFKMQMARIELLKSRDKQDIRLGKMLDDGKDAMKHAFIEITSEKQESPNAR